MNLRLDAHEARRKLSQQIEMCTDFQQMKIQAKQICEELVSARLRFKDHVKVEMAWVQKSWKEVADGSADDRMKRTEKTSQKLQQLDGQEEEITTWTSWIGEVKMIEEISWADEIDRLNIVA